MTETIVENDFRRLKIIHNTTKSDSPENSWENKTMIKFIESEKSILDGLKAIEDVKKYGFKDVEEITCTLSDERMKIIRMEQKDKSLKEFLVKKIAELDQRISKWSNFTQSGQSQYAIVSLRLDTYKEILSEITGDMA